MLISKDSLEQFKAIYTSEFGEDLNDIDLEEKARMLLNVFTAIYRSPIDLVRDDTNQESE